MSDIHRQDDFLWSAVGLFYALVLWFCARNFTGAMLLGQAAATGLLVAYSWQTLKLRKAIANPAKAAEIGSFSVLQSINNLLKRNKSQTKSVVTATESPAMSKVTEEIAIPQVARTDTPESEASVVEKKPLKDEVSSDSVENSQLDTAVNEQNIAPKTTEANTVPEPIEKPTTVEADKPNSQPAAITDEKASQVEDKSSATQLPKSSNEPTVKADNKPVEPQTVVQDNTADFSSNENAKIKPDEVQPTEENPDNPEQIKMPQVNVEPASTEVDTKSEPEKTAPKKASSLDSLETVEVAEVLEAAPEDMSSDRESDRSNIIEVTTTEINITTETQKIDLDEDNNPDSEQK